jgi:hypothetical protein
VVRRFGVGGTLQISPVSILLSSIATVLAPGVVSASAVRLTEASTRYTLNRTGMELLYMPLPQHLRNRIKAFIDICVDRLSRGLGGVLLLLLTVSLKLGIKGIAAVVMLLCVPWVYLSYIARREYVATIRRRFESRRLDFAGTRLSVTDAATIRFLEATAAADNPRQAAYALELLADAPGYDVRPLLDRAASGNDPHVRAAAFEIAARLRYPGLKWGKPPLLAAEVTYAIAISQDRRRLAGEFLDHADPVAASAALDTLRQDPALAASCSRPNGSNAWKHRTIRPGGRSASARPGSSTIGAGCSRSFTRSAIRANAATRSPRWPSSANRSAAASPTSCWTNLCPRACGSRCRAF